jgi:hypothetical protein
VSRVVPQGRCGERTGPAPDTHDANAGQILRAGSQWPERTSRCDW